MSAKEEVQKLTERLLAAAATGEFTPFIEALDDDVEVFDHVPFRFDTKLSFIEHLKTLFVGAESLAFYFRHPSYRAIGDTAATVTAYDHTVMVPKDGGPAKHLSGRTSWVFAKRAEGWKIVSAHFSPLPRE